MLKGMKLKNSAFEQGTEEFLKLKITCNLFCFKMFKKITLNFNAILISTEHGWFGWLTSGL